MKLKFAAIAAVAFVLAAPAFAVTDYDFNDAASASDVETLAASEFAAAGALAGDGNVAIIVQSSSGSLASIEQFGATNFASIVQTADGSLAMITQTGDSNRARIYQH